MTEIKRYDIDWSALYRYDRYPVQDPDGEWVRWEDVKDLLDLASDVVTLGIMEHHEKVSKDELHSSSRSHVVNPERQEETATIQA
jgi:hypothetical protein